MKRWHDAILLTLVALVLIALVGHDAIWLLLVVVTVIALAGASLSLGLWLIRIRRQRTLDKAHATYELTFPRDLDHQTAARFFTALSGLYGRVGKTGTTFGRNTVVFELLSTPERLHYLLSFPPNLAGAVRSHLTGVIRDIGMSEATVKLDYKWRYVVELRRDSFIHDMYARKVEDRYKQRPVDTKMVDLLLASLRGLEGKEAALIQFVMTPTGRLRDEKYPEFWAVGRLAASSGSRERARRIIDTVRSAYGSLHVFADKLLPPSSNRCVNERRASVVKWPGDYIPEELAVMCGLPIGTPQVAGLVLGRGRQLAPEPGIPSGGPKQRIIAMSNAIGAERPLAMLEDDRLRHLYLVGPTGTGKSTAMQNLVIGDIRDGYGVAVIDPKAKLVAEILDCLPPERADDVIVFDIADQTRIVGLNMLAGDNPYTVMGNLLSVLDSVFDIQANAPRALDVLRSTLLTLAMAKLTLVELPLILEPGPRGQAFRDVVVPGLTNPELRHYWRWFDNLSATEQSEVGAPIMRRLRPLLLYPVLKATLGQVRSGFDIGDVLRKGKILLVPIPRGILGDELASLISSLVLARLWQEAQRRLEPNPKPFFCYVDEFGDIVRLPVAVEEILGQARGYGFGLILANQHTGQMKAIRTDVFANARSKLVFRPAKEDAKLLAAEFGEWVREPDLMNLGSYEVIAELLVRNQMMRPVTAVTQPPPPRTGLAETIREASRQRYGRPWFEVEAELATRHGDIDSPTGSKEQPPEPIGWEPWE